MIVMNAEIEAKRARLRENYRRWYATAAGREKAIACTKAWSEANKDRKNAKRRAGRQARGEEYRAERRELYAKNPEPHNQSAKKYREKNRFAIKEKARKKGGAEDAKRQMSMFRKLVHRQAHKHAHACSLAYALKQVRTQA